MPRDTSLNTWVAGIAVGYIVHDVMVAPNIVTLLFLAAACALTAFAFTPDDGG